jgi:hyperosmotically inducible periplasmic protein
MTGRTPLHLHRFAIATGLVAALASAGLDAQNIGVEQRALAVRRALERLPNYGVFDFLSFGIERGTVTLAGYAHGGALKSDAENAVKRVSGVDEVANQIEVLPVSANDDRIRSATFYKIYSDSFLSRYSSGGAEAALYEALEFSRFPGRQPFGLYPIHIVVNRGRTTLLGYVDTAADRQLAEFRAREVSGVFAVENELMVAPTR